ncbi:sensor histidine kinase [Nocardioides kribbensis]|uniref:sensor histidine kinase n=1 Tax=Nocardioides kribbensis TaxID=305517 RepID=UPI00187A7750|nr:HAMP domain-containing sensor histidine kinase [Nocardioides kribbensis]
MADAAAPAGQDALGRRLEAARADGPVSREGLGAVAAEWLRGALGTDSAWFQQPGGGSAPVAAWAELGAEPADDRRTTTANPTLHDHRGRPRAMGALGAVTVQEAGAPDLGHLVTWSRAPRAWTAADRRLLRQAADGLALALDGVTAPSEAERAAEDLDARTTAAVTLLSHELRTPLTVLMVAVEMLLDGRPGPLTPQQQRVLERMQAATERLGRVATDAVALVSAGTDAGDAGAADGPGARPSTDLDRVLDLVAETASGRTYRHGHRIAVRRAPTPPGLVVLAPAAEVREVLERVVDNAAKFSAAGTDVFVASWLVDEATVEIIVSDSGQGIPPEDVAALGRPFAKSSLSLHREDQGLGLGLAAAQRMAEAWGGSIELDARPGEGVTVVVRMPGGVLAVPRG